MSHLIETVYNLLWGDLFTLPVGGGIGISLMAVLLLTAGVFFTLRTRLLPVRLFRDMIAAVCEKNQSMDSLSSFQTLIVSTATRVGMGNLVGVVAAVSAGGAGAVFWMWVTAILGRFAVVTRTLAYLAGHIHIRQEVHLDLQNTVALTGFAAAALDIKAETPRAVTAHFGILCLGEYRADIIEHTGISGRIGARRTANGLLVDTDDLIHKFQPFYPIAFACAGTRTVQLAGKRLIQNFVDEAGLAGAGNAGNANKLSQREFHVDIAQVIFPCTPYSKVIAVAGAAGLRYGNAFAAGEIIAGDTALCLADVLHAASGYDLTAMHACARAYIHDIIRAAHGIFIMLHHNQGIAKVTHLFKT